MPDWQEGLQVSCQKSGSVEPAQLCPQGARPSPPAARLCPYCGYSFVPAAPPGAPPAA